MVIKLNMKLSQSNNQVASSVMNDQIKSEKNKTKKNRFKVKPKLQIKKIIDTTYQDFIT